MAAVKRLIILFVFFGTLLSLTACDSSEVYQKATEYEKKQEETLKNMSDGVKVTAEQGFQNAEDMVDRAAASGTMYISKSLNKVGWIVIFVSLLIGILLAQITAHTAAIKLHRTSIVVFIIGIPVFMLVLMYGMAFLSSWFM